jgi:glucose-6-phosphate isomerase
MFVMIYAGLDYQKILAGAKQAYNDTLSFDLKQNSAALYACLRHYFFSVKNFVFENLIFYDPLFCQWGEH